VARVEILEARDDTIRLIEVNAASIAYFDFVAVFETRGGELFRQCLQPTEIRSGVFGRCGVPNITF
jgi:hypothetical protein